MADEKLQTLIDRAAVSELMQRYAMSIDSRDWDALRSCFADEMEIDISETPFGKGAPPLRMSGDRWLDQIKRTVLKFAVTQHMIAPYRIEVKGDRAVCMAYLQGAPLPARLHRRKIGLGTGRLLHQHHGQERARLEDSGLEAHRNLAGKRAQSCGRCPRPRIGRDLARAAWRLEAGNPIRPHRPRRGGRSARPLRCPTW